MNDLEQRLRDYGTAIDGATAADLADRNERVIDTSCRPAPARRRRVAVALVLVAIAGVAIVGVVLLGHRDSGIRVAPSPAIPAATSTSSPCPSDGGDSAACPEEGPPLTPQQKARFAQWRREYNPDDLARIVRQSGADPHDDVAVVETMEGAIGCTITRAAWAVAKQAAPDRREAAVDGVIRKELARLRERNWPPQSQMPGIFQRLAGQLERGEFAAFDAPRSLFEGECGRALPAQP